MRDVTINKAEGRQHRPGKGVPIWTATRTADTTRGANTALSFKIRNGKRRSLEDSEYCGVKATRPRSAEGLGERRPGRAAAQRKLRTPRFAPEPRRTFPDFLFALLTLPDPFLFLLQQGKTQTSGGLNNLKKIGKLHRTDLMEQSRSLLGFAIHLSRETPRGQGWVGTASLAGTGARRRRPRLAVPVPGPLTLLSHYPEN